MGRKPGSLTKLTTAKRAYLEALAASKGTRMGVAIVPEVEQMIKRVWALKTLDDHREPGTESIFVKEPRLFTSALLGIGERQIQRVLKASKAKDQGTKQEKPKTKVKPRYKFTKTQKNAIRECIRTLNKEGGATAGKIAARLQDKGITLKETQVKYLLKVMNFVFKASKAQGKIKENDNIKTLRTNFVNRLLANEREKEPLDIVWVDESYLHQNHVKRFTWQELGSPETGAPRGKGKRFNIIWAGNRKGWIDGAKKVWIPKKESEDYHGNVDVPTFEDWFQNQLLPNLKTPSLIVLDNASYHKRKINSAQHRFFEGRTVSKAKVGQLRSFLESHGIDPSGWDRPKCYKEARKIINSGEDGKYAIQEMAEKGSHRILFLPPYHPELNAIELMWGVAKNYVALNRKEFTMTEAEQLLDEGFKKGTADVWRKATQRAIDVAMNYNIDSVDEFVRSEKEVIEQIVGTRATAEDFAFGDEESWSDDDAPSIDGDDQ